nr:putative reverse transcriptase domain-containing protein [Tanacetum cinerariifolium]
MAMTIQFRVKRMILAAQSEAFKEKKATAEMLCDLDQLMERKEDEGMYFIGVPLIGDVRTLIMDEAHASRMCMSPVLWAEIRESRLIGPELVQETTDKKYLADANLHVHSEEIKIDKTLRFVEEPEREVKSLKRSKIPIVKVHWNLKRGHEDFIKSKYPHLVLLNGSDEYAYSVLEWTGWVRLLSFGIDRMGMPTQY